MPSLGLIRSFARELLVSRSLPREPEPDLVMDDPAQVSAYAEAGRIDGVMAAAYLFHSARITQTIVGSTRVLDLGCGPATQLAQVAQLNPAIEFVGVDLSPTMLEDAKAHIHNLGLNNVSFRHGDITCLGGLPEAGFDGVISTMALHHLPSFDLLNACFAQVRRVLKPGGAVYITDFGRLKSLKSVLFFAYMNAKFQPHLFSLDYERSLRAAFVKEDFQKVVATHLSSQVKVESTFKVPFLIIAKTADRVMPGEVLHQIRELKKGLKPRYRNDLNDMRIFFALGGLKNDPF